MEKISVSAEWAASDWEIIRRYLDTLMVSYEVSGVDGVFVHVEVTATPTQVMRINNYIDKNI